MKGKIYGTFCNQSVRISLHFKTKFCNQLTSIQCTLMITKIPTILILLIVCHLPHQQLFSQYISHDNYTGFWEDSLTWDPPGSSPHDFLSGYDITINGIITAVGSLGFYNLASNLIVNDTLVVKGNLFLHNNNDLIINDQGILIIRGNLWIDEHSHITANGCLIVTGNIYVDNFRHYGSFTSNDDPPAAFFGGSVYPHEIRDDEPDYSVLNCSSPITNPYPNSGCTSGNMLDLENDPVYPFFLTTCNIHNETVNISVCPGDSIHLAANGGADYYWNGPAGFTSELQNPSLAGADSTMAGTYTVIKSEDYDCEATDTTLVIVNLRTVVSLTSSDDTLCMNEQRALTGSPAGGIFRVEKGPGQLEGSILTPSGSGKIYLEYSIEDECSNTAMQTIISYPQPHPFAGPDQELNYLFETKLEATLDIGETGTWSLISGTGEIEDIHSPESAITGLSPGESIFLWTVNNGLCESGSQVTITVLDPVVPTVFTPNGDGINDAFYISKGGVPFDITVFNQWGIIVYESPSFIFHWDGSDQKGNLLPPETYFYEMKFENGLIKKGTVLIVR